MEKLLFNTGVKPHNSGALTEHEEFINNEKHIAFYVDDIPENGIFQLACDNISEYENKPYYATRKIIAGGLLSEYAVFLIRQY